jgi:hypothetical protein
VNRRRVDLVRRKVLDRIVFVVVSDLLGDHQPYLA